MFYPVGKNSGKLLEGEGGGCHPPSPLDCEQSPIFLCKVTARET